MCKKGWGKEQSGIRCTDFGSKDPCRKAVPEPHCMW